MRDILTRLARRVGRSYVLFVVVGLLVGAAAAPAAYDAADDTEGTVAVVPLEGTIDGRSAARFSAMMTKARQDPSVKAVVIVSNSGGGAASASETQYFQTKRTAERMPVVAAVDASAASGAYYTIAPADVIYVKPSSIVGSIGVLAPLPTPLEPNDVIATTGPNKLTGADEREFLYVLESLHRAFVRAVVSQRGGTLELSRAELEQARVYSGAQAVRVGLADRIGDREAAVRAAARRAGLDDYDVRVLRPDNGTVRFLSRSNYLASTAPDRRLVDAEYLLGDGDHGPTFLMLSPLYVDKEDLAAVEARNVPAPEPANATAANATAANDTEVSDAPG